MNKNQQVERDIATLAVLNKLIEINTISMNATKDDFKNQFKDKKAEEFKVTKTGAQSEDEIDALSGATITSRAMVGGVNAGLCAFRYVEEGE